VAYSNTAVSTSDLVFD